MNTVMPNRLTRTQVQEKIKKNFQALCTRCPQLNKTQESLDDSLTSLQWLWNMNVNISNPLEVNSKRNELQHNDSSLTNFPGNLINGINTNNTVSPAKFGANRSPHALNFSSKSRHSDNGSSRTLARDTRKLSAPAETSKFMCAQTMSGTLPTSSLKVHGRAMSFLGEESLHCPPNPKTACKSNVLFQKFFSSENQVNNTPMTAELPKIHTSSSKLSGSNEPLLSEASTSRDYSFSPRQATLNILPGQVDYKNNPYVKPVFSFTTLIYMALQSNKRHKLSVPDVCKWITDNFIYYRYADPDWQNVVQSNIVQSKHFCKVQKKKESSTKSCLWQIDPKYNDRLPDVDLSHFNAQRDVSTSATSSSSNADADEFFLQCLQSRKRKQTSPQKVVRRRTTKKRRDSKSPKAVSNRNLLQEQAPELGSLKGDFNWNSIFEEFFSNHEAQLSTTPTSLHTPTSRSSCRDESEGTNVIGQFSEDIASGAFLAHDEILLPHIVKSTTNDENHDVLSPTVIASSDVGHRWTSTNDRVLHSTVKRDLVRNKSENSSSNLPLAEDLSDEFKDLETKGEFDCIDGFLKDVDELDLTITGRQIEVPSEWVTECPDLDAILCEKQNDLLFDDVPYSNSDPSRAFLRTQSDNTRDQNSVQRSCGRSSKQRKPTASSSQQSRENHLSPPIQPQRRPWQEVKDATETIENLLSSTFSL